MNESFFKKCWNNKRLHALMVLMIWVVVLVFLTGGVYLINMSNQVDNKKNEQLIEKIDNKEKEDEVLSYYDKLEKLINSNYEFTYLIIKNGEKIKFDGTKEESVIVGYKQSATEIVKYKIENKKTYQIFIDREIEITNLYDDIDASLLELNYVVGILKQISENEIIITEEENITTYDYNLTKDEEELEITVVESNYDIEKIIIHRNNETYDLMYKEIA